MRVDAPRILESMGFRAIDDFVLSEDGGTYSLLWFSAQPQPSEAAIDAAALGAAKERKIRAINAECRSRLLARYGPAEEQVSRSIGIYGAAEKTAMEAGIAATIDASNTGSNSVLSAGTEAAVEAVSVSWPVI